SWGRPADTYRTAFGVLPQAALCGLRSERVPRVPAQGPAVCRPVAESAMALPAGNPCGFAPFPGRLGQTVCGCAAVGRECSPSGRAGVEYSLSRDWSAIAGSQVQDELDPVDTELISEVIVSPATTAGSWAFSRPHPQRQIQYVVYPFRSDR